MIFYCAELDRLLFICGSENVGTGSMHFKVMVNEGVPDGLDYTEFVEGHEWTYIGIF